MEKAIEKNKAETKNRKTVIVKKIIHLGMVFFNVKINVSVLKIRADLVKVKTVHRLQSFAHRLQ